MDPTNDQKICAAGPTRNLLSSAGNFAMLLKSETQFPLNLTHRKYNQNTKTWGIPPALI